MKTEVIILRESWTQSIASDAGTVVAFAAMIGLGVHLDSAAMQWIGGILFFMAAVTRSLKKTADGRMSIDQAIAHLEALKAKEASHE